MMESQSSNGGSGHNVILGDDKKVLVDDGIVQTTPGGSEEHISASVALDPAAERRLVWKFDCRLLPCLAVMYFFNALVGPCAFGLPPIPPPRSIAILIR